MLKRIDSFVNLWIKNRERFLRKGIPIESERISRWRDSSRIFKETSIDWKARQISQVSSDDNDLSGNYSKVYRSRWKYEDGSPFRVKSTAFIPKKFGYKPEDFDKSEILFYSQNFQVKPNYKTSFHLGKFPGKFGSRPNIFRYPDEVATEYFLERGLTEGNPHLPQPRQFLHVSGSWDTNYHTIQRQMDTGSDAPGMSWESYSKWRPTLKRTLSKLQASELPPPEIEDIDRVELSPKTFSGCRWDKFFGLATKESACSYAREISRGLFKRVSKKITPSDSLWTIGGREAREDNCLEDNGDVTSRGVHMPEVHEEILNFLWSRPVEKFFHSKSDGPIWLGHSFNDGGWKRLKKNLDWSSSVIEGDWKKFDSSINEEKMVIALAIIRSFYPDGAWIDRHFLRICDQLVFKNYVVPGGYIFRIVSGIPSGSAFTALLNSVVNFLCLNRFCVEDLNLKQKNSYRLAIGGDDFLIFLKDQKKDEIGRMIRFGERIGMELKESSKWTDPYPERVLDYPSFYKQIVYKDLPTIRPDHLYERILAPNSMIKRGWSPERYLNTLFASPPALFGHLEWLIHLVSIYSKRNKLPFEQKDIFKLLLMRFERSSLFSDKELEKISREGSGADSGKSTVLKIRSERCINQETLREARICFYPWLRHGKVSIGNRLMRKVT